MPQKGGKPYIPQFFNRDRLAFTALSKVGYVTEAQLKECGLASSRVKNYLKDKLIEKVTYKDGRTEGVCFKLTEAGKQVAEREWNITRHYHTQSPNHDLGIAKKYFSLPEQLRDSWKSETEVRDMFREHLAELRDQGELELAKTYSVMLSQKLISMPDGLYINEEGVQVSYEVVTNNYGESELQAKECFVAIMKTDYETTRV